MIHKKADLCSLSLLGGNLYSLDPVFRPLIVGTLSITSKLSLYHRNLSPRNLKISSLTEETSTKFDSSPGKLDRTGCSVENHIPQTQEYQRIKLFLQNFPQGKTFIHGALLNI